MSWVDTVQRMISRAVAGIRLAFRGEVRLVDGDYLMTITGLQGEVDSEVELFQQYGFASRPPADAEFVAVPLGRRGMNAVVVATRDIPTRLALAAGEAGIGFSNGGSVVVKANGDVEVTAKSGQSVKLDGTNVDVGASPVDMALLGTTFKANFDTTFLTTWNTALTPLLGAIDPLVAAYATAMQTAIGTLKGSAVGWLAAKARVK